MVMVMVISGIVKTTQQIQENEKEEYD